MENLAYNPEKELEQERNNIKTQIKNEFFSEYSLKAIQLIDDITNKVKENTSLYIRSASGNNLSSMDFDKISELLKIYKDSLLGAQTEQISKDIASLAKITESIDRLSTHKSISKLESTFTTLNNELRQKHNIIIYKDINKELANSLSEYFGEQERFSKVLIPEKLEKELLELLNNFGEELIEIYDNSLQKNVKSYKDIVIEVVQKRQKETNITSEIEKSNNQGDAEVYTDESGILKINPNYRAQFIEELHILGYEVRESDDGVYAVSKDGMSRAITYNQGKFSFADNPNECFCTNINIENKDNLYFYNDKMKFMCSLDYLSMSLIIGDVCYKIGYDSNGKFICEGLSGNKKINDSQTILGVFMQYFPEATNKVKNTCLAYEEAQKVGTTTPQEAHNPANVVSPGTSNDDVSEALLAELNGDKDDVGNDMSIDDEIFALEQDPKVRRYIELMKLQADEKAMNQDTSFGIKN